MMPKAEEILKQYREFNDSLTTAKINLRFDHPWIKASDIAEQYYCEKAVELKYEQPLEPTEEMKKGQEGHETITSLAAPIPIEDALTEACRPRKESMPLEEVLIKWHHLGVPIVGKADQVWFRAGSISLLVERKFSGSLTIRRRYHVQAKIYCLGLGAMGFDTSATKYRICVFAQSCHDCQKLADWSCPIFQIDRGEYHCDRGEVIARIYHYDESDATKDIDWALDYWVGRRKAVPTKNQGKCRGCNYKDLCSSSLA